MKKNFKFMAVVMSAVILLSSCIGSFNLTNRVKDWNEGIGSKFVNELVFIGLHIIPVYEITILADVLVLNSIEFWTGNSAVSKPGDTKIVKNSQGEDVTITTCENGYNISNGETAMNLVYDDADKSWSVEHNNQMNKIMKMIDAENAQLFLLNGETIDVTLDDAGVNMARQLIMNNSFALNK